MKSAYLWLFDYIRDYNKHHLHFYPLGLNLNPSIKNTKKYKLSNKTPVVFLATY